jgi:cytochrome d ubiquinol oxidase subunit II
MLMRRLSRDDVDKRLVLHSIGPVWDGNEVWLIVAGGATFAAFPEWYASLFSGFYVPLFVILIALIARGAAFEFWGKAQGPRARAVWEWAIVLGSLAPALLWGVAWANLAAGVPMDGREVTASLLDLLGPYALLGGLTTLLISLAHGATFLELRTLGPVAVRARTVSRRAGIAAAVVGTAFLAWTIGKQAGGAGVEPVSLACAIGAVALLAVAPVLRRRGWAFAAGSGAIVLLLVTLFAWLFPHAIAATGGGGLTLHEAASSPYTLKVMTIVAVTLLPLVLLYQGWTYWVFRHRLGRGDVGGGDEPVRTPMDLLARVGRPS